MRSPRRGSGAPTDWYDGVDADCGGDSDYDADGDGFDALAWRNGLRRRGSTTYSGACNRYDVDADCGGGSDYDVDEMGLTRSLTAERTATTRSRRPTQALLTLTTAWMPTVAATRTTTPTEMASTPRHGGTDCDDAVATPTGCSRPWYDGVDAECGGDSDYDADGDGFDRTPWRDGLG